MRRAGMLVDDDFLSADRAWPLPQGHLPLVAVIEHVPDDDGDSHDEARTATG